MFPTDTSEPVKTDLPRERFEPVISRPIDLESLSEKELALCFLDKGAQQQLNTCYGDLYKVINALMDYAHLLDMVCDQWDLQAFHRATYEYHADKLRKIAAKFQAGIGYDYAAAVEKCQKRRNRTVPESDIGDDALAQMVRRKQPKKQNTAPKSSEEPTSPWEEDT